jgi:hypothetical protein
MFNLFMIFKKLFSVVSHMAPTDRTILNSKLEMIWNDAILA